MRVTAVVGICLAIAPAAGAQESGATVSASAAVTNLVFLSELTVAGAADYRFNRIVGFEIEVTAVPTLRAPFPTGDATIQSAATATLSGFASLAIFPGPRRGGWRRVARQHRRRLAVLSTAGKRGHERRAIRRWRPVQVLSGDRYVFAL
jgi:hypothetical protein